MLTKNLVQTSVNVIRITNLKVGDIYKRYDDNQYSSGVFYGLIKDIKLEKGEKIYKLEVKIK